MFIFFITVPKVHGKQKMLLLLLFLLLLKMRALMKKPARQCLKCWQKIWTVNQ